MPSLDTRLFESLWSQRQLWLRVVGFFGFQLLFEGLNEALVTLPGVPHGITWWSITMQFVWCTLLPIGVRSASSQVARSVVPKDDSAGHGWIVVRLVREWLPFAALSAAVFLGNGLSQYSTHYVEFTLKIVAKSSKLLPTMLIANFVGNAGQYGATDYAAASLLCIGTAMFSYGGGRATAGNIDSKANLMFGMTALGVSCLFDGFVPNAQQRLMRTGVDATSLMARTNALGALGGIVSLMFRPDTGSIVAFVLEVPKVLLLISGIGLSLASSVLCYTELVQGMGSVFTVGVATLRKTVSLVLSYLLFAGKSLSSIRVSGLVLVGVGLLLAERQAASRKKKCS